MTTKDYRDYENADKHNCLAKYELVFIDAHKLRQW